MNQTLKNKEFIIEYLNALSGKDKPREIIAHYVTDEELIEHIVFFDGAFPKYELTIEELIAEGDRVVLRSRLIGKHEGVFGEIMPSHRSVDFPFVITYTIENRKIVSHWLVADQTILFEQLGIGEAVAAH
jgi:predicted ester cyclase